MVEYFVQYNNSLNTMRNNNWLTEKLYFLWENHFVDVPRKNPVLIKFGKRSYRQLGSISWARHKTQGIDTLVSQLSEDYDDKRVSLITVTGYFKDERIPETVVLGTIAHEMIHYSHGFNSPLKQIYDHPHKGGIIRKEMYNREMMEIYNYSKKWLKSEWRSYLKEYTNLRIA